MPAFALLPLSPSILDLRSLHQAVTILHYAQGKLVLNRMRTRDRISRELQLATQNLGVSVAPVVVRDLQAFRDVAQNATVVTRLTKRGEEARSDMNRLFAWLLPEAAAHRAQGKEGFTIKEVFNG